MERPDINIANTAEHLQKLHTFRETAIWDWQRHHYTGFVNCYEYILQLQHYILRLEKENLLAERRGYMDKNKLYDSIYMGLQNMPNDQTVENCTAYIFDCVIKGLME